MVLAFLTVACSTVAGAQTPKKLYLPLAARDATPTPSPTPVRPSIDELLAVCPTAAEVASVDASVPLRFEHDPTAAEGLSCRRADGSADLTRLQRTAYAAILAMRWVRFDAPLPWTNTTLDAWFAGEVRGVRFRDIGAAGECCEPERVISIDAKSFAADEFAWVVPSATPKRGVLGMVLVLVHEARHADGQHPHTCDNATRDRTVAEMGAFGVMYRLYEWLADRSDPALFRAPPGNVANWYQLTHRNGAEDLRARVFCEEAPSTPTPTPSPTSTPPPASPIFVFGGGVGAEDRAVVAQGADAAAAFMDETLGGAPRGPVTFDVRAGAYPTFCCFAGAGQVNIYVDHPNWATDPVRNNFPWGARTDRMKIIAHEYVHVWQAERNCGRTGWPTWMVEGGAEHLAYRVMIGTGAIQEADATAVGERIASQDTTPLQQYEQGFASPNGEAYSVARLAVDRLAARAGVPAMAAFCDAAAAGNPWRDAFAAAFGIGVDAFYADFQSYRDELARRLPPGGGSSPVSAPAAPTGVRATRIDPSRVQLVWTDNAGNEQGFRVYRYSQTEDGVLVATLPANTTSHVADGLAAGTSYCFYVAAYGAGGEARSTEPNPQQPANCA